MTREKADAFIAAALADLEKCKTDKVLWLCGVGAG